MAKTKKRVYVKASKGRKAHYRTQEVGREEIAPVENLWEITADQFGRLVSGSKISLQAKYIEEHSYTPGEKHPKLEHLVSLMNERMRDRHSPPIFEEFTRDPTLHSIAIFQALGAHEKVPLRVLKDYPEAAYSYEIDISDEALEQEPPQGEITRLYEMSKDEYDAIIAEVTKDYESDPLKITDAMLKEAYPQELEDTKRAARMRKKLFGNVPDHLKEGFCPETMNAKLHFEIIKYAFIHKLDIPMPVKKEYPTLFKGVPFNYASTGDKNTDAAVNEILTEIRDKCGNDISGISDVVAGIVKPTADPVPIKYKGSDGEIFLMSAAMDDISRMCGNELKSQLDRYTGNPVTIEREEGRNRAEGGPAIKLAGFDVNVENRSYNYETIVHEYGHSIEHMVPEIAEASRAFRDRRTEGEDKVRLTDIHPNMGYNEWETTQVDHFMTTYIGKIYPEATEVLSTGIAFLTTKESTQRMYREDPEYLGFILAVMAGKIGSRKIKKRFSVEVIKNSKIEINLSKLNT